MKAWLASRIVCAGLLVALLGWTSAASARPVCDAGIEAWVSRCAASAERQLELVTCHHGVVVVRAPAERLDVELRARTDASFRSAGSIGLSPVGQFADWSRESEARRTMLEALVGCAERDPNLPLALATTATPRPPDGPRAPWLLIAALATIGLCLWRTRPKFGREAQLALGLAAACALLRWLAAPGSFFHQNGQGPLWVAHALGGEAGLAAYGPGFAELFALPARLIASEPERGLWLFQSLLAATVPPAAWFIARRLGAKLWLAAALALGCALDPLLARLAATESYFSSILSLCMLATAATSAAAPRLRGSSFFLPIVGAALLVAQMLRIHPSAWPVALTVPLPLLLAPGSVRRRLTLCAAGGALMVVIAAIASGSAIFDVMHGTLGQKWLPRTAPRWELLSQRPTLYVLGVAVVVGLSLRSFRGLVIALAGVGVVAAARLTDLSSDPNAAVTAAHQRMYLPAVVVLCSVAIARGFRAPRAQSAAALALVVLSLLTLPARLPLSRLPTDAREAEFVRTLRVRLELKATVAYLERADSQVSVLPLYAGRTARRAPLRNDDVAFDLGSLPQPAYYFRSSLCATPHGAPVCAAVERGVHLEPVAEATLPAIPSMRWNAYQGDEVKVTLLRVHK